MSDIVRIITFERNYTLPASVWGDMKQPSQYQRDTLIWIVPVTLIAFLYWSVANYMASVEYGGQIPDEVRNSQYAVMIFILGFIGFIITYKRKTFTEDGSPTRPSNWGLALGGLVMIVCWGLSAWLLMGTR
jgi:hypothetical protein